MTLYIAAPLLVSGTNDIIVLEMDGLKDPSSPQLQFEAVPDFTGPGCDLADAGTAPAAGAVVAMFPCTSGGYVGNLGVAPVTWLHVPRTHVLASLLVAPWVQKPRADVAGVSGEQRQQRRHQATAAPSKPRRLLCSRPVPQPWAPVSRTMPWVLPLVTARMPLEGRE
jgi:hypothetical protein